MDGRLDTSQLFTALREQVRNNFAGFLTAVVCLVLAQLFADNYMQRSSFFFSSMISLFAQYYITRTALMRAGVMIDGVGNKFFSFWGMSIISGLLILLGCVLLIIPGVYLAARWFVAGPALIAEDKTATEGMTESWELLQPSVWHVAGALVVLYGCGFGLGALPFFLVPEESAPLSIQAISALFMTTTSVLGWLMSVGIYTAVAHPERTLEEVFA